MKDTKFAINTNIERVEWEPTLKRLSTFLDDLQALKISDLQLKNAIDTLLLQQNDRGYWGFIKPHEAASDERVDYYYKPTYLVTAIMMHAWQKQPAAISEQASFVTALSKAMEACTARAFSGHGYEGISGMLDALMIFAKGSVAEFLDNCPAPNTIFVDLIKKSLCDVKEALVTRNTLGAWGEDLTDEYIRVWKAYYPELGVSDFLIHKVFVYGTLMKGEANHSEYMKEARFEGKATLPDYALYDLGIYPAISPAPGNYAKGEVYSVSDSTLKKLHYLEGEGSLYTYKEVSIVFENSNHEKVGTYMFCDEIDLERRVPLRCQPWNLDWKSGLVWYASYGSNMLEERFLHYLQGRVCRFNNKRYEACNNSDPPLDSLPISIPHPMYFGNTSNSWGNGGVCFIDSSRIGDTLGRLYLITKEQLEHIHTQEGRNSHWYDEQIELGNRNGIPIVTLTNHGVRSLNSPINKYLEVVRLGLQETYPEKTSWEIEEYLIGCM